MISLRGGRAEYHSEIQPDIGLKCSPNTSGAIAQSGSFGVFGAGGLFASTMWLRARAALQTTVRPVPGPDSGGLRILDPPHSGALNQGSMYRHRPLFHMEPIKTL
jgi:hypothetical protein